ncbi:MAG: ABC transporter ATP-binding protein/permease [Clostridiales bacterium]|nr:ABC transporter ATP-binding protein/permease [Clostridiales bacterium]
MEHKNKKVKAKREKPRYNMLQNSAWMISTAWHDREKKVIVLSILTAVLAVCSTLINTYITPSILSKVETSAPVSELILTIVIFSLLLIIVSAAQSYVTTNTLYGRISVRMAIVRMLFRKAADTSYSNLWNKKFDKLINQGITYTQGNSTVTEAVWTTLTNLLKNILGFIIYLALLATLEWWIVVVVTATTVAGYLVTRALSSYEYKHREEMEKISKKIWYSVNLARESKNAKDFRLFGMTDWLCDVRDRAFAARRAFASRAKTRIMIASLVNVALAFIRNGIAYVYLIERVIEGGLSASEFLLYFNAVGEFTTWVSGIFDGFATLYEQSLELSIVRETLEFPEPFSLDEGIDLVPDTDGKYEITLENVSFSYPESDKKVLDGINLTLHAGEKLAVVGLNGAGKTTLVKLICGFFDPTEGEIKLNGVNIRKYKRRDYYKMFSAVFQNFSIIADSVSVNVAASRVSIDGERVRECIEKAGLKEKIESLPNGYDTKMNREVYDDAVMLSGGETQRLIFARSLYKNSPVIVLDEPTAALDPISEASLYESYGDMTDGKSSIYISHRLASTRFCDRIILIKDGKIAEEGTHDTLLAAGGTYAELFEVQSKYYRADFKPENESINDEGQDKGE